MTAGMKQAMTAAAHEMVRVARETAEAVARLAELQRACEAVVGNSTEATLRAWAEYALNPEEWERVNGEALTFEESLFGGGRAADLVRRFREEGE